MLNVKAAWRALIGVRRNFELKVDFTDTGGMTFKSDVEFWADECTGFEIMVALFNALDTLVNDDRIDAELLTRYAKDSLAKYNSTEEIRGFSYDVRIVSEDDGAAMLEGSMKNRGCNAEEVVSAFLVAADKHANESGMSAESVREMLGLLSTGGKSDYVN